MTRNYKATIILDSRGYDAPVETLEEKISGLFRQAGGEILKVSNQGRRDFVRITDKGHTGDSYLEVEFSGPPECVGKFQESIRLDKRIKRALIRQI